MLLFSYRVSSLIVRILHCHTWTENIMERERILPHETDLWCPSFPGHKATAQLDEPLYPREEEDNSLDNSIGVAAAFSSDVEGKRNTSGRDLC